MNEELCPEHSKCRRHAPANYSCSCDPGYVMTTKQDKCVVSSDHVTSNDHMIGGDHVTGSNVISNDHVTASDVTHTVGKVNSSIIHIILSVDEEHMQGGSLYNCNKSLVMLYRPRHYTKLHIETFSKP